MARGPASSDDRFSIHRLRDILLHDDREEVERLRQEFEDPELLKERVLPLIQAELELMKEQFPQQYAQTVEKIIIEKFKTSQQEILDVIYPVMGRMIRKYIRLQLQQLREGIEEQVRRQLTTGLLGRLRYALFGLSKKEKAAILESQSQPAVEEIYVVEQYSGLLIGSASYQNRIDMELIAGMLTAIKSFIQDAFQRGDEELECIEYGDFMLVMENYHSYYIVAVLSGGATAEDIQRLRGKIRTFAETDLVKCLNAPTEAVNMRIREALLKQFFTKSKQP